MRENDPDRYDVILRGVKIEDVPELLSELGGFTVRHGIDVVVNGISDEIVTEEDEPNYNPELVDYVDDLETGTKIPVITHGRLVDFVGDHLGRTKLRLAASTYRAIVTSENQPGNEPKYIFSIPPGRYGTHFLRADRLNELVQRLNGRYHIENIGRASIDILEAVLAQLYVDPIEE